MSSGEKPTTRRWWRPHFTIYRLTVRDLVLVVTLLCVYLGLWEATKRAVPHPTGNRWRTSSPFPFVIREDYRVGANKSRTAVIIRSELHLWSFGNEKREPYPQPMCEWRWETDYQTSLEMFPALVQSRKAISPNATRFSRGAGK